MSASSKIRVWIDNAEVTEVLAQAPGWNVKRTELEFRLSEIDTGTACYAAQYLLVYEDVLKQGGGVSPVAAWAKGWMDQHGAKP